MRAEFVLSEIRTGLRRNLTLTVAVITTTAVCLMTLGMGLLIGQEVNTVRGFFYGKLEVVVFLDKTVSPDQKTAIEAALAPEQTPEVKRWEFETKAQACKKFKDYFRDQPALLDNLDCNALPESYRLKLRNLKQFDVIQSKFEKQPGVDQVINQKQQLNGFLTIMQAIQFGAYVLAAIMLVSAALLISNTIRVAAFSRRRETAIMRLVGASNLYVQLPFLLEGIAAGLVGTMLGFGALAVFKVLIIDGRIRKVLSGNLFPFIGWDAMWSTLPVLLLVGVGLSAVASFLTLRKHLRV